jgi:general secretion pathway protein G
MRRAILSRSARRNPASGMSLLELILACTILLILATTALPVARSTVKRSKEAELRRDLREMRTAIDRYKDAADKNLIQTAVGSEGYPPDLDTLVNGVNVGVGGTPLAGMPTSQLGQSGSIADKKVRFLRRVPIDPMTGRAEWGLRSVQDDADADSWGGTDVFDVYSMSMDTALDGTKYSDW